MAKRWTWEEVLLLKKVYGSMPVADLVITYFPDKTELAITAKVHALRKAGWTFDSIRRKY